MVNIVMVTYNQESYIAEAIESVIAQICSFSYLLVISDDCSNDKTIDICTKYAMEYPDKILFIRNEQNLGLVANYKKAFDVCIAKYIAILEGDDYWIDNLKLQKQFDILDSSETIGLVHGGYYTLFEDSNKRHSIPHATNKLNLLYQGDVYEKLIQSNFIMPLTVLFRKKLVDIDNIFHFFITNHLKTIDYGLWLLIALDSDIKYLEDPLGVYRVRRNSISNALSIQLMADFLMTSRITVKYFLKIRQVKDFTEKEVDAFYDETLFSHSLLYGDQINAKFYGKKLKKKNVKNYAKFFIANSWILTKLYSWSLNKLK